MCQSRYCGYVEGPDLEPACKSSNTGECLSALAVCQRLATFFSVLSAVILKTVSFS